ncbi:hypothetical protein FHS18_002736 [Paenibacillus phyllosphaerae]|uniref:histidine kinase n=1 Tax=Paenibacillus phyllosphaerae TaxID=274593 RepID=A0A7W5FN46_9BACL|nr:GAF domain-containing sensor histidine kinase [Paenibacillus phyllosphaerae]MBB3110669.1 hypothetical protein [Paenibacillus phyllosphaerae]
MNNDPRIQELLTLKTIAEMLNQAGGLTTQMLNQVLEKLLALTGLTTAWILFIDDNGFESAADLQLPPALLYADKQPMRCAGCSCVNRFRDGRLDRAVNILNCKRIEDAMENDWGDTRGITHHATVPLRSGELKYGVLNVAAPGKRHFEGEELALLEGVALQIGSAIERMHLYAAEQRRSDLFTRLGAFSRALGAAGSRMRSEQTDMRMERADEDNPCRLMRHAAALIGEHFDWPFAALFTVDGPHLVLRAMSLGGELKAPQARIPLRGFPWLHAAVRAQEAALLDSQQIAALFRRRELKPYWPPLEYALAAPIPSGSARSAGLLLVGDTVRGKRAGAERDVLEALGEHLAIVLESDELEANRRELARLEERNKLARDLHDSVSQMLFSLSMTAKGVESLVREQAAEEAIASVRDMQDLSQHALKEMRALIMQLRPAGLEAGLATALGSYGEKLGLTVSAQVHGLRALPRSVEEALWRIGQEALNNIRKHAGTTEASVTLTLGQDSVLLRIADTGRGIAKKRLRQLPPASLGLSTMEERAAALGGRFQLTTSPKGGTIIEVHVPLAADEQRNKRARRENHDD